MSNCDIYTGKSPTIIRPRRGQIAVTCTEDETAHCKPHECTIKMPNL